MNRAFLLLTLMFMVSCTAEQVLYSSKYILPIETKKILLSRKINKSPELLWEQTLDHLSNVSPFRIESFEKASRLITLSLETSEISSYTDCGTWNSNTFSGPYTEFRKLEGMRLFATISILISKVESEVSEFSVNANYRLIDGKDFYEFSSLAFDELKIDNPVLGTGPIRKCQSTNLIEQQVLAMLDG